MSILFKQQAAREQPMSIKDIVVYVDEKPASARLANIALGLAERLDAHLAAVHVVTLHQVPSHMKTGMYQQVIRLIEDEARKSTETAERQFREAMARFRVNGEWRVARGDPRRQAALHARYADLVVIGQHDPDSAMSILESLSPEDVVLESGRPALVIPYAGKFDRFGDRILVAWNASRESARAVADAMPFLRAAKEVMVLAVNPRTGEDAHGEIPSVDIATHLARHGVKVTATHTPSVDLAVSDAILNRVSDDGMDMLVMGAYGRSRLRELVLGGVTRDLLRHMTVPVLMSH
jgi:nucleotide-binding universal stress UspA family protein